eukprot:1042277-Lingulodinium_polyedra.AAC.1
MGPTALPPKLGGCVCPAAGLFFLFGEPGRTAADAVRGVALAATLVRLAPPAALRLRPSLLLHH